MSYTLEIASDLENVNLVQEVMILTDTQVMAVF